MWQEFNPSPRKRKGGDCAVRAVAKALDVTWEKAYVMIALKGFEMGDVISSNAVWGAVLKDNGFERHVIPNTCPECYTAEDFANEHPDGIYVLGFDGHVATVAPTSAGGSAIWDAWDSSQEIPQYYWTNRKDD